VTDKVEDTMSGKVDLYDGEYGNYEADVYQHVRTETYGVDFGQTSWVTTEESTQIPSLLELTSSSSVLEIGCGSGVYALHIAKTIGCAITGLDINAFGVQNANQLASRQGLSQAHFEVCDVSKPLPFADQTFDVSFSNDVLCHIPGRPALLAEMYRVLKPGGRMLFSDALIIGGIVSQQDIATRSSIGYYLFSPPGENQRLILQAGFTDLKVSDTTGEAAGTAARWYQAREKYRDKLLALEGEQKYSGLQRFLSCVQTLTQERRLLRLLYQARKA
jgi:ubiquinone/menaquinone biosynthesis C-methylase UbiE